jgi:hypothetical protein
MAKLSFPSSAAAAIHHSLRGRLDVDCVKHRNLRPATSPTSLAKKSLTNQDLLAMTNGEFSDSTTLKAIQPNLGKRISTGLCNSEQRALSTIHKMRTGRRDRAILTGLGGSVGICHLAVHFIHSRKNYLILPAQPLLPTLLGCFYGNRREETDVKESS